MTTPNISMPAPERRMPSIGFPLVLISLGIVFLLANTGYLQGIRWSNLLQLWPVLLVIAGVDILLRPRSFALAAVVDVAIIVAALAYLVSGAGAAPASFAYSADVPRAAATDLDLTVNYGAGALTIVGGGTSLVSVQSTHEDISRTVDQTGSRAAVTLSSQNDNIFGWNARDRSWDVKLPSDVRTGMTLNLGAGDFDVDLSGVTVTRATINAGASDLTVTLPKPTGNVPMTISGGASSLTIVVPSGVAYSVKTTGVLHSVMGPQQSSDYATATDRVTIEVSVAAGSVTIR